MLLRRCVSFVLLMVALPLSAQQVFKCVDGHGVAYQSMPCSGTTEKTWDVPAANEAPARASVTTEVRGGVRGDGKVPRRDRRARMQAGPRALARELPDACRRARAGREAAYRKAGLKRGFKLSSDWDNRVWEACR